MYTHPAVGPLILSHSSATHMPMFIYTVAEDTLVSCSFEGPCTVESQRADKTFSVAEKHDVMFLVGMGVTQQLPEADRLAAGTTNRSSAARLGRERMDCFEGHFLLLLYVHATDASSSAVGRRLLLAPCRPPVRGTQGSLRYVGTPALLSNLYGTPVASHGVVFMHRFPPAGFRRPSPGREAYWGGKRPGPSAESLIFPGGVGQSCV